VADKARAAGRGARVRGLCRGVRRRAKVTDGGAWRAEEGSGARGMETLESSRMCRLCGQNSGISINIFDESENHVRKINAVLPIMVRHYAFSLSLSLSLARPLAPSLSFSSLPLFPVSSARSHVRSLLSSRPLLLFSVSLQRSPFATPFSNRRVRARVPYSRALSSSLHNGVKHTLLPPFRLVTKVREVRSLH